MSAKTARPHCMSSISKNKSAPYLSLWWLWSLAMPSAEVMFCISYAT